MSDNDIFIYTVGGEVPQDVIHVLIDESIKIIPERAFFGRRLLETVECHDNVKQVGRNSFTHCHSLRWIKIPGVIDIDILAFANCEQLEDVEFGDKLETIKEDAFRWCASLRSINLPSIKDIRSHAFMKCTRLADVELSESLDRPIGRYAFAECPALRRIAIPLKDGIIIGNSEFGWCSNVTTVNLVGRVHRTVSYLHLECWRNEMNTEIERINQVLPTTSSYANDKTGEIQQWVRTVLLRMEQYKAEHGDLLIEATTILELALWKSKLKDTCVGERDEQKRLECRVNCGSNIIIPNVLAYLKLPDEH
mmetsp:Transcript_3259/g.4709  ORF Transcript_3259/g.4709 Transcript_3259/m.4709 type:complete len:308 (-) Transcript_3259:2976-3899(-)